MTLKIWLKEDEHHNRFFTANGNTEDFKCSECLKIIETGYLCENNDNLVLCNKCQNEFKMCHCRPDKSGEHRHIKWIKENAE